MLALFVLSSCSKKDPVLTTRSVLLYVAGNNSLSSYTYDIVGQLDEGYLPDILDKQSNLLVYFHSRGKNPILCKLNRKPDGGVDSTVICVYPESTDSATPEQFAKVLRDAEHFCPAERHGLIFWSHGSGFIPKNYKVEPRKSVRSVGSDEETRSEIEIQDFANALLPGKYDYIIFDCCLMGGVEVAYELKEHTDYLLFSSTEVMNQGYPYYMMMEPLFTDASIENALKKIAVEFYDFYMERYEQTKRYWCPEGGTISLIKAQELEAVAQQCKTIFSKYRTEITALDPDTVQEFYQDNMYWFYDLSDFVRHLVTDQEFNDFTTVLNKAVLYKGYTPKFQSITIDTYCGLSCYIPNKGFEVLNAYYQCLKWNQTTGLVLPSNE